MSAGNKTTGRPKQAKGLQSHTFRSRRMEHLRFLQVARGNPSHAGMAARAAIRQTTRTHPQPYISLRRNLALSHGLDLHVLFRWLGATAGCNSRRRTRYYFVSHDCFVHTYIQNTAWACEKSMEKGNHKRGRIVKAPLPRQKESAAGEGHMVT